MLQIESNKNLKSLNTFGIKAYCDYYVEIRSGSDFIQLIASPVYKTNKKLILGGGSNVLFCSDFTGLVIKNELKGIDILSENEGEVIVKAAAGENWHGFVLWTLEKGLAGLENLSLIPGCVGAGPMQNIGAYGVEIKEVFESLEAMSMKDGSIRIFTKEECHFDYRESVFKNELKGQYFITSVNFRLKKNAKVNASYGAISSELDAMQIKNPGIKDISKAVIAIRQSKLPDPKLLGNAGSFFKNPVVSQQVYSDLKSQFPDLVAYPLDNREYKLAAGWLIEQCGLKGFEINGAAVHTKQALVLVNKNNCTGNDIYRLSEHVIEKVIEKFGVRLQREVNLI